MIETREFRGWWWLPKQSDDRLPGTLIVSRGEAELDLTGHFGHEVIAEGESEIAWSFDLARQPRILGLGRDGEAVTSGGHQSAAYDQHSAGVTISRYRRQVTLVGRHFEAGERILFDEIAIRASDLTAWTQTRIIETKLKHRKRGRGSSGEMLPLAARASRTSTSSLQEASAPSFATERAKGVALYLLVVQLRTLIEMALLRELGFKQNEVDAILAQARRYERINRLKSDIAGG